MSTIKLENIIKEFGKIRALDGINIEIGNGEFFVLYGPAGAGKTTMLKIIAGLEDPTKGHVSFDGQIVDGVIAAKRNIAMVFENYALYPNLTVFDNIASPLRSKVYKRDEKYIRSRVLDIASLLGLENFLERKPNQLSNGQKQRVALGRSLVRENPNAFLLDEPIAHLDAKLRNRMRTEFKSLKKVFHSTVAYVTHDYEEAVVLGDRMAIINHGKIVQVGTPDEIYYSPVNSLVAKLVGEPEINFIVGEVFSNKNRFYIRLFDQLYDLIGEKENYNLVGNKVTVGIRGENIELSFEPKEDYIKGYCYDNVISGNYSVLTIKVGNEFLRKKVPIDISIKIDEQIFFRVDWENILLFNEEGECLGKNLIAKRDENHV